jgi:hypothetical protein
MVAAMMRVLLLAALFMVAACGDETDGSNGSNGSNGSGGGACQGPNTGSWDAVGVNGGLFLGADCTFRFTGNDGCQSRGSYAAPIGNTSGTVRVDIESVSPISSACLPAGTYTCAYLFQAGDFGLDCGGGIQLFTR